MIYPVNYHQSSLPAAAVAAWRAWRARYGAEEELPWIPVGIVGCVLVLGHFDENASSDIPLSAHQRVRIDQDVYQTLSEWLSTRGEAAISTAAAVRTPEGPALESDAAWRTDGDRFAEFVRANYPLTEGQASCLDKYKVSRSVSVLTDGMKEAFQFLTRQDPVCDPSHLAGLSKDRDLIPENLRRLGAYSITEAGDLYVCAVPKLPFSEFGPKMQAIVRQRNPQGSLLMVLASPEALAQFQRKGATVGPDGAAPGRNQVIVVKSSGEVTRVAQTDVQTILGKVAKSFAPDSANITGKTLWEWIFHEAVIRRATDILMVIKGDHGMVRFFVDRAMQDVCQLPLNLYALLVGSIKSSCGLQESQKPQDGNLTIVYGREGAGSETYNLRLNFVRFRTTDYQAVAIRMMQKTGGFTDLGSLGFEREESELIEAHLLIKQGLFLTTGPTGSGKSTTLYSGIDYIRSRSREHIITIEDPIEKEMDDIVQMEVNERGDEKNRVTFGLLLRAAMRQNPKTILVGEIRDEDSAKVTVRAASTGHRVLSTMHTNSAPEAVSRLIDLMRDPKSGHVDLSAVVSALNLVIAQRLLRRLCECAKRADITEEQAAYFEYAGLPIPPVTMVRCGCAKCRGTGYYESLGIIEFLPVSRHPEIARAILSGADAYKLREIAGELGYPPLFTSALKRVANFQTSFEEAVGQAATSEDTYRVSVLRLERKESAGKREATGVLV